MTAHNNNISTPDIDSSFAIKRVKPRYITLNEDIFMSLSPEALKIYLCLRYESDYNSDCSSVKKNIKFICNKSGIKRSTCFEAFCELENKGLLKRESEPGYQSIYWISPDLNYFIKKEEVVQTADVPKVPVQDTDYPVQDTDYPVQDTDTIANIPSSIVSNVYIGTSKPFFEDYKKQELEALNNVVEFQKKTEIESEALNDLENQAIFNQRFSEREVTIQEIFKGAQEYYQAKGQMIGSQRFKKWLRNEKPENFPKKSENKHQQPPSTNTFTPAEMELMYDYNHAMKFGLKLEVYLPNETKRNLAIQLVQRAKDLQCGNKIHQRPMQETNTAFSS